MDISIFTDKSITPTMDDLTFPLGKTLNIWKEIRNLVLEKYPSAIEEWNFPGKKYGWSFRMKDKKRAIIYFLPRKDYFKVAFVFGQKATDHIMQTDIAAFIKEELQNARVYAEGRGIRIDITNASNLEDIKNLITIKLKY